MFLLKDVCFDYTKAEIYGILGEVGNIYQVLNSKGPMNKKNLMSGIGTPHSTQTQGVGVGAKKDVAGSNSSDFSQTSGHMFNQILGLENMGANVTLGGFDAGQ